MNKTYKKRKKTLTNKKRKKTLTNKHKNKHYKNNHKTKKRSNSVNIKKLNCSPKPKNELNQFSCYTNKQLLNLREHWNARHPDAKIKTNSPKEIHDKLSEYLNDVCNNEACWLKQKTVFGKLESNLSESFAPEWPDDWKKNPNEWLSSVDIMKVMKQYEKAYKCFDFMGPTPINFDSRKLYGECVWEELCKFDLKTLMDKGINKIGIIFNTDPDYESGQHWISMFINIKRKTIMFFDSTGVDPPEEVNELIKKIVSQGTQLKKPIHFKVDCNKVEHQNGNTECGVYSLFFIIQMLEDKITENYLKTHLLNDKYMEKFRRVYFNFDL